MPSISRFLTEYGRLCQVLSPIDFARCTFSTATHIRQIVKTGRLGSVDNAMSRTISARYRGRQWKLPLEEVDKMLPGDSPTFGSVRELFARDCYFAPFRFEGSVGTFLDLGANRGMVSFMALACLGAECAIAVEPQEKYNSVAQLLLHANNLDPNRSPRYNRFITSPLAEMADPVRNISIETIRRDRNIDHFGFVKIDIEGGEIDLFREPNWLAYTNNLAMEVHPCAGDLSMIPAALKSFGFRFVSVNQSGQPSSINDSMFVYASRNDSSRVQLSGAK